MKTDRVRMLITILFVLSISICSAESQTFEDRKAMLVQTLQANADFLSSSSSIEEALYYNRYPYYRSPYPYTRYPYNYRNPRGNGRNRKNPRRRNPYNYYNY
jgi:hypothetical protein